MSRIPITDCSSSFGQETAKLFLERGWEVVALREVNKELRPESDRLLIVTLDVTDPRSVAKAIIKAGDSTCW